MAISTTAIRIKSPTTAIPKEAMNLENNLGIALIYFCISQLISINNKNSKVLNIFPKIMTPTSIPTTLIGYCKSIIYLPI